MGSVAGTDNLSGAPELTSFLLALVGFVLSMF